MGCVCELDFEVDGYVSCSGCTFGKRSGKASTGRVFTDQSSAASCEDTFSSMVPSLFLTAVVANTSEYISLVWSDSPTKGADFLHVGRVDNNSDEWDMIVDSALSPSEIKAGSLMVQIETSCGMREARGTRHAKMKNRHIAVCTQFRHKTTPVQTAKDVIPRGTNLIK